jgi:glycosyltransferase involved in cell wall biosynthesis
MRLLIVVPWGDRLGGAEGMLQTVLDGAGESGHELELVFLAPGPWAGECAEMGFHVEVIPAGQLRQGRRAAAAVNRLRQVLRERRPDLILSWMGKAHLYCSPAAVLAGMRDRVIWWQHGIPAGHWLDRCATALPAVAVGSSSRASALAQAGMFPSRSTFVVAPGTHMPTAAHEPLALELPAGVPVIGMVGRLQPWKGQDRLLEAQALLRERGHLTHALIVGGDAHGLSPRYAHSLPGLTARLGLTDAVTMTGQVPDAGPYIERMDVLVNASEAEPFGIVLLEGMARGVAVLAVDSAGPREILRDGSTGVLASSGDPTALADALEALLVSPERRGALGLAGRERYLEQFTDTAMRGRFFGQLEELLRQRVTGLVTPV